MRLPSTNPVSLPYGATSPPYSLSDPHAGTDYAGSDLNSYAPEQVTITAFYPQTENPDNPCGNQLDMVSLDGVRRYRFCHSSEVYARVGQTYSEGAVLAKEGDIGQAYGVHLHCVMWVNGERVDPDATIKSIIGDDMKLTEDQVNKISVLASFVEAKTNPAFLNNVGLDLDTVLDNFLTYPTTIEFREKALSAPANAELLKPNTLYKTF